MYFYFWTVQSSPIRIPRVQASERPPAKGVLTFSYIEVKKVTSIHMCAKGYEGEGMKTASYI